MGYEKKVFGTQGQMIGSVYAEKVGDEFSYQASLMPVYSVNHATRNMHLLAGVLANWKPNDEEKVIIEQVNE